MRPAVIYAAKSTEDTQGSIGDQFKDGRALAAEKGYEALAEFGDAQEERIGRTRMAASR